MSAPSLPGRSFATWRRLGWSTSMTSTSGRPSARAPRRASTSSSRTAQRMSSVLPGMTNKPKKECRKSYNFSRYLYISLAPFPLSSFFKCFFSCPCFSVCFSLFLNSLFLCFFYFIVSLALHLYPRTLTKITAEAVRSGWISLSLPSPLGITLKII